MVQKMKYCLYPFKTARWLTRSVQVGPIQIGGGHPIRIQSMTTTPTACVDETVEQIMQLSDAGCEMVRVTVQGMKEAYACEAIKSQLIQKGYTLPIVADIHFFPKAALQVVDFVDKVRINPGNFADKRANFKTIEYTDELYQQELIRVEDLFSPLVEKCKKNKVALRIGTNHGSLSDRVMNRYGDTAQGMVISAFEYAEICQKYDFHELIFSMKSSNTQVMIEAYRLLVAEMMRRGWNYPLHLGVTEAGLGEDGRSKSAVGIGSLLLDGLGDTIRVSLTEDPIDEIKPCKQLIQLAKRYQAQQGTLPFVERKRLNTSFKSQLKPFKDSLVALKVSEDEILSESFFIDLGLEKSEQGYQKTPSSADLILVEETLKNEQAHQRLKELQSLGLKVLMPSSPYFQNYCWVDENVPLKQVEQLHSFSYVFLKPKNKGIHFVRQFYEAFAQKDAQTQVILAYSLSNFEENFAISCAAESGSVLVDELVQGLLVMQDIPLDERRKHALYCLQASRKRSFKTEFISCPSCGRTLFDLQQVTQEIKAKTQHLPGVKIAVMGCIVNGPGEMADAHFGYVGSKPGKIDLYVGKTRVEKEIDHSDAVDRLIVLLKKEGVWKEPQKELDHV